MDHKEKICLGCFSKGIVEMENVGDFLLKLDVAIFYYRSVERVLKFVLKWGMFRRT